MYAKSIQNQPKWCQGVLRKRPWEQDGARLLKKTLNLPIKFGLLVPLGRFRAPFWCPAGRQGAPKIELFTQSRTKISKNEAHNEASKNL